MRLIMQLATVMLLLGLTGATGADPGDAVRGNLPYNRTHVLTAAEPSWSASLPGSANEVMGELWAVAGLSNPQTGPGSGIAAVIADGSSLQVGYANWQFGSVFYHFRTEPGFVFTGGTVSAYVGHNVDAQYIYIATSDAAPAADNPDMWTSVTWTRTDEVLLPTYSTTTHVLDIPVGDEFWFGIVKPDAAESTRCHLQDLTVSATITLDPAGCVDPMGADLDDSCMVDLGDFARLAGNWMQCNDPDDPVMCY